MNRTTGEGSKQVEEPSGATVSDAEEPSAGEPDLETAGPEPSAAEPQPSAAGGSIADVDGPAVGEALPADGRHVWVPPDGAPREVRPEQLRLGGAPPEEGPTGACAGCGGRRSVETVVREHVDCGQVGLDGFVSDDGESGFACPKCGAEADAPDGGEEFAVVGTVYSCLRCGRVLDRPLDGAGDG